MALTLNITLGNRIKLAERLPKFGTIEYMYGINSIKQTLVGFGNTQMINWRIIPYGDTLITALPDTGTTITLSDEQIKVFAQYINERNMQGSVEVDEAELFKQILEAEAELIAAEQAAATAAAQEMMNQVEQEQGQEGGGK